jgi:hypothetical protein
VLPVATTNTLGGVKIGSNLSIDVNGVLSGVTTPVISTIINTGTLTLPTSTDTLVGRTTTDTLTNKRITSRVSSAVTATTYSLDSTNYDTIIVTPTAGGVTISVDAGTPTDGQKLLFRVYSNSSVNLTFAAGTGTKGFRQVGVIVPGTTVAGKMMYIGCMYNTTDVVWDIIAYSVQA